MKTRLIVTVALACASASGFATAQGNSPTSPPPGTPPPSTMGKPGVSAPPPPQGPRDANGNVLSPLPATQAQGGLSSATGPKPMSFQILDRDKAGSLNMDQVRGDPWLSAHFTDCDINHNEEVTQSEYETCVSKAR